MIEVYYTTSNQGSFGLETTEEKVKSSIGGYKSSSLVVNDEFNNLFPDVSMLSGSNERYVNNFIALALLNNSNSEIENVNIWISKGDEENFQSKIYLSAIAFNESGKMERIPTQNSKPVYSSFEEYSEDSKLVIDSLEAGQTIGLWIWRELLPDVIKSQYELDIVADTENPKLVKENELGTKDSFSLEIEWDD